MEVGGACDGSGWGLGSCGEQEDFIHADAMSCLRSEVM
jgi:hypothetical protein